jgi:TRAP-type C4-dicarboxylate transport system substrate-binding protein
MEIYKAVPVIYTDEEMVKTVRCYENVIPTHTDKYIGVVHMNIPEHGVQEFPFPIPDVHDLFKAFEQFDECLNKQLEQVQAEHKAESNKIISINGDKGLIT